MTISEEKARPPVTIVNSNTFPAISNRFPANLKWHLAPTTVAERSVSIHWKSVTNRWKSVTVFEGHLRAIDAKSLMCTSGFRFLNLRIFSFLMLDGYMLFHLYYKYE